MKKKIKVQATLAESDNLADNFAVIISDLFGSLYFLAVFGILIAIYLSWNFGAFSSVKIFDAPPFATLDTILSIFSIILTISVLISQRRQRRMEKIREQVEFEVNIRAEHEITKILEMLHTMQQKMGIDKTDLDLEEMKKDLNIEKLHDDIKQRT